MSKLTVKRPGGTDQFGNPLPGSTHTIRVRAVAPRGASDEDDAVDRAQVITSLGLYAVPGSDLLPQDVVVDPLPPMYTGDWQVQGDAADWRYLSGRKAGVVAVLKRGKG